MYEKKEEFNFVIDKTHVKLEVHFELNESDVIFEFRKDCAFVNAQHPERKNNCEMSIGEITHLAAIFLYESVVELIRQKPEFIPQKEVFEYEGEAVLNITLCVKNSSAGWSYKTTSTFCDFKINCPAEEIMNCLVNALENNTVVKTMYIVSPIIVWVSMVHEFLHHVDHASVAREKRFSRKYAALTKIPESSHFSERNPHMWLFLFFSNARIESVPTFGKEFEKNNLKLFQEKRVFAVKGLLTKFVQTLKEKYYRPLWEDGTYIIGYHVAMIIALAECGKKQLAVVNRYDDYEEKKDAQEILTLSRDNDDSFIVLLPKAIYEQTQKKVMQTKKFFEFLLLYEDACNTLDIPQNNRVLSVTEYRQMIADVRKKTLSGQKVSKTWSSFFKDV